MCNSKRDNDHIEEKSVLSVKCNTPENLLSQRQNIIKYKQNVQTKVYFILK